MPTKKTQTADAPAVAVAKDGVNVTAVFNPATAEWEPVKTGDTFPVTHPLVVAHPEWFIEPGEQED